MVGPGQHVSGSNWSTVYSYHHDDDDTASMSFNLRDGAGTLHIDFYCMSTGYVWKDADAAVSAQYVRSYIPQ